MTTDEYFEQSEALKLLAINLKSNIEILANTLDIDAKQALLRMNKIMIKQCMEDHGINFSDESVG